MRDHTVNRKKILLTPNKNLQYDVGRIELHNKTSFELVKSLKRSEMLAWHSVYSQLHNWDLISVYFTMRWVTL